jgi:hypothetical protein
MRIILRHNFLQKFSSVFIASLSLVFLCWLKRTETSLIFFLLNQFAFSKWLPQVYVPLSFEFSHAISTESKVVPYLSRNRAVLGLQLYLCLSARAFLQL